MRSSQIQISAEPGVHPRDFEVERHDGKCGEQAFDEALCARLLQPAFEPVETVQQLGRRDRRDREFVVEIAFQRRLEIELAAFGGDKTARIDQDSHRFSGTVGLFIAVTPDSTAFR